MVKFENLVDGVGILRSRFIEGNPKREISIVRGHIRAKVAQSIYDIRNAADLNQEEFAKVLGVTKSVIVRLEDAGA